MEILDTWYYMLHGTTCYMVLHGSTCYMVLHVTWYYMLHGTTGFYMLNGTTCYMSKPVPDLKSKRIFYKSLYIYSIGYEN